MQNKERFTRFAIGRIVNGQFVYSFVIVILGYEESYFIKKYIGNHRTIRFVNNVCHSSIISQNLAECKQYLKKKSILICAANNPVETRRDDIISSIGNEGACSPCCYLIDSYIYSRVNPWQKTQNKRK